MGGIQQWHWLECPMRWTSWQLPQAGSRKPPPLHPQIAGSNEVATNRSGGFVGTWLGFSRDRMSCWEQPLCLSFLSPFQAFRPILS